MTLLEMTQSILSDIGGDEVNSIEDTFEASQVAEIIRTTYLAMMSNRNWPHLKRMCKLTAAGNVDTPTHFTITDDVKELLSVKYNCAPASSAKKEYQPIIYKEPDEFLRYVYSRDSSQDNVQTVIDPSGVELFIINNAAPKYMTSFNDVSVVMDSFDSEVDSTLQESKIQVMAYVMPEWEHTDNATPDLPTEAFSALLETAKSTCFLRVAQRADQMSAVESRRQQAWLSRKARKAGGGSLQRPSFGRGRVKLVKDPTFRTTF